MTTWHGAAAARLVDADVDVVVGGIYSSTRQAIKVPVVDQAGKLYLYPEQYEGQECDPLIFCTGPVPAQQIEPFFPWLMEETGAKTFYLPSADYIWPHTLEQEGARGRRLPAAARSSGSSTSRSTTSTTRPSSPTSWRRVPTSCSTRSCRPGLTPFLAQLHEAGFIARGGTVVCTYFDENFLNLVPAEHVEGLYGCLDYYRDVQDPFSIELAEPLRGPLPGQRHVHGRFGVHRHLPGAEDVGVSGERGGLAQAARRHRGPRPRPHPAGSGRPRRDGARPAPRADEHVHRAIRERQRSRWSRTSVTSIPRNATSR